MINIFETSFEARDRRFQIEKLYHGETVDLVGVVTTNGVPQNITGYSVSGVFQPTSMNGSPDFYELSADIVDNKVIVHWEKGKDFGENSYMVWALLTDGDNASYPIAWRLDMAYSPSYPLSSLEPIPKAIDFSKYELLNAPWLALSDVNDLPYLPLSGGTVDGDLVVTNEISAANFTAKLGVGINIGNNSISDNGVAIGVNSTAIHGSVAIGNGVQSDGFFNTAIGTSSKATGSFGLAIGQNSEVSSDAVAVGQSAHARYAGSLALGHGTYALALNAIQLGSMASGPGAWSEQKNTVPHSLRVMDKMVLSGDNLTLDPERVPYLSGYETKEDAATDHQTLSADLTAYVDEKISEIPQPQPPPVAGVLTLKQNESVVVEYNPDDSEDLTATITVPEDLSAFTNSPGYATSAYVQEYVDEHGGGGSAEGMSACLSSDEFGLVEFLLYDENGEALSTNSITEIGNKINNLIALLKRVDDPHASALLRKTYVKYTNNSEAYLDITGTLDASSIPNLNTVKELRIGTDVTSLGSTQLTAAWQTLTNVTVPNTITDIPNNFLKAGDSKGQGPTALTSLVLPNTIATIGTESFRGCSLTSFTFPANTTSIGNYCFSWAQQVREYHINAALTSIGSQVFGNNFGLSAFYVDENNQSFKADNGLLLNKSGTELWKIPSGMTNGNIVVPEGVTKLKFDSCNQLTCSSLTFPTTLTTIEQAVFNGSQFTTPPSIPSSVTSIAAQYWNFPIVFADRTKAQVQAMSGYPWSWSSGAQYICTDGTLTR